MQGQPWAEEWQPALLSWYEANARDLPWRRTRDPYAILVSEVMLQQTRVDVAAPYYARWMRAFPDWQALAAADLPDVLALWSGLGYYSRARRLKECAELVAAPMAGGRKTARLAAGKVQGDAPVPAGPALPRTAEGLQRLPGIGPYSAGAVASIAFAERVPCVDGNVVRVLARLRGWRGTKEALLPRAQRLAARLVPGAPVHPGQWNQAVMELGATVCTPRNAACIACPVAAWCKAKAAGNAPSIPAASPKAAPPRERHEAVVVQRGARVLLAPGPRTGLLAGLLRLPTPAEAARWLGAPATRGKPGRRGKPGQRGRPGTPDGPGQPGRHRRRRLGVVRHTFSHRRWDVRVQAWDLPAGPGRQGPGASAGMRWVRTADLDRLPLAAVSRKAIALAMRPEG